MHDSNLNLTNGLLASCEPWCTAVHAMLCSTLETEHPVCRELNEAMRRAVIPGGKRWRPLLTLAAAELGGVDWTAAVPAAAAVELIHCSSLVFDDLPCMDDTAIRRGRSTVHVDFGEGIATLAGIGLLTRGFELLARSPKSSEAIRLAAQLLGPSQMLGGQGLDLTLRTQGPKPLQDTSTSATCRELLNRKTTALLELALGLGALHGTMTPLRRSCLASYGRDIGLAYQQMDDLVDLDCEHTKAVPSSPRSKTWEEVRRRRTSATDAIRDNFAPSRSRALLVEFAEMLIPEDLPSPLLAAG